MYKSLLRVCSQFTKTVHSGNITPILQDRKLRTDKRFACGGAEIQVHDPLMSKSVFLPPYPLYCPAPVSHLTAANPF